MRLQFDDGGLIVTKNAKIITHSATPRGKKAVMTALVEAATDLFAAKGPAQVSVREIADKAGVNHGLVHRHFGSKEGLLKAVMEGLSARMAADTAKALALDSEAALRVGMFKSLTNNEDYLKILARSLLDGKALEDIQDRFPIIEGLIDFAAKRKETGQMGEGSDPRAVVAFQVASVMGWLTFERYLLASTGLDKDGIENSREAFLELARKAATSLDK